jgi:hypothetical protein
VSDDIHTVLGIDPGGSTGVAILEVPTLRVLVAEEYDFVGMLENLRALVKSADLVSIERFTISARTLKLTRQPDALYLIGATMLVCHEEGVNLELESPGNAKSAFPNEMLKLHGVWHSSRHVRDSLRHTLLAMRRHGLLVEKSLPDSV